MIIQEREIKNLEDLIGKPYIKKIRKTLNHRKITIEYAKIHASFDIETTRKEDRAYMYIWQFQLNEYTIIGRRWEEFEDLVSKLNELPYKILVWVANLGHEFAFISRRFQIDNLFAKETRQPLKFDIGNLEFRDALAISGGSLSQLAKDYTKTQKTRDLDYTIERSYKTPLSDLEMQYCINDVIILKEFSEFLWDRYISKGFIPITKTGILRKEVSNKAREWCRSHNISISTLYQYVANLYPETASQYNFEMEYLFRGGFTHANARYVGETIEARHEIRSEDATVYDLIDYLIKIDFTSSYPFSMFNRYVPVSPFTECEFDPEYLDRYCCKFIITLYNVETRTTHSIESKSKIIDYKNAVWDNGRLRSADEITVFITELDYKNYKRAYRWTDQEIIKFEIARRGYIPKYLLDVLYEHYKGKNDLKKRGLSDTPEYAIEKSGVNSGYGLTVTRLCFQDVSYNNSIGWCMTPVEKTYKELISSQILSPYFGIWITCHSRFNEIQTLFDMCDPLDGHDVIYSDTDSHVLTDNFMIPYIETYNKMIVLENAKTCYRLGYDMGVLWDIGTFDIESDHITRFLTLGAKRYLTDEDGKIKQTISGLGKKSLMEYANAINKDPFEIFNNEMYIPEEYTHKLRSVYNDEPTEDVICGVTMREESSVALVPVEFTLKLSQDYINLLGQIFDRTIRRLG